MNTIFILYYFLILLVLPLKGMDQLPAAVSSSSSGATSASASGATIRINSQDNTYDKQLSSDVVNQALTLKELKEDLTGQVFYTLPVGISGEDFTTLEPYLTALAENRSISMERVPFKQLCSLAQTADHLNVPAVYHTAFNALVHQCTKLEMIQQNGILQNPDYQKLSGPLQARIAQQIILKNFTLYSLFQRVSAKKMEGKHNASCVLEGTQDTCCFTPDGQQVACVNNKINIELINPNTGTIQSTLAGSVPIRRIIPAHSLPLLAAIAGKNIGIWNIKNVKCLQLNGHTHDVDDCDFGCSDTKMASVSLQEQKINIWDVSNGNCMATLLSASSATPSPSFRSKIRFFAQRYLAVSEPQQVSIYDTLTNTYVGTGDSFALSTQDDHTVIGNTNNTKISFFDRSSQKDIYIYPNYFPISTSIRFDSLHQNYLMQTSGNHMSVFPVVDSSQVNNLSIENLIALLYVAKNIKEGKSSVELPNAAIARAFRALPDTLRTEINSDITRNCTWFEWFKSVGGALSE